VGVPSSGLHSNGYTLARRVIADSGLGLADRPAELHGRSVGDALLEPTLIYVRAVSALLAPHTGVAVHGLAHITGEGVLNLLRLHAPVGYEIDAPLAVPAVCRLVCERGDIGPAESYEVFNMGCGFVCVVPEQDAETAAAVLAEHHPGAAVIGRVTDRRGRVELPGLGLSGDERGLRAQED
jgi:phosphoribosylformylglycinamidine cyclo-ligase